MQTLPDPDALGVEAAHPAAFAMLAVLGAAQLPPSYFATAAARQQEQMDARARACGVQLREVLRSVFERDLLPMVSEIHCGCCGRRRPLALVDMRDDMHEHEVGCSYAKAKTMLEKLGAL